MTTPTVRKIARIGLTVADVTAASKFYEQALGFSFVSAEELEGERLAERFGVATGRGELKLLRLGDQHLELVSFHPPGRPYPAPGAANDPWFQHFAIAVSDMPAAYARVSGAGAAPVSQGGPQLLPPSTGSVTAYKFRDPEGHPLELSYSPHSTRTGERRKGSGPFLGIDHTAIAVKDVEASLAFYVGLLGMKVAASLVNTGPEQDRLDGLPEVLLDIVVLDFAEPGGPHIELLAYRTPKASVQRPPPKLNDVAATRTVLDVDDLASIEARLNQAGTLAPTPTPGSANALLVCDPDGHLLELRLARSD